MAERRRRRRRRTVDAQGVPLSGPAAQTAQEELRRWKRRVARAQKVRRQWADEYQVQTLERFYLGRHTTGQTLDERVEGWLNHFFATVQTQRPGLLPQQVSFLVEPKAGQRQADARLLARTQQSVLDAIAMQDRHLMKILRLAATQAFFRAGVLKVSYDPRLERNPRAGQPLLGEDEQALLGADGDTLREPQRLLTDEVYRWQWVNACHMLLPDEGPDTTRWTWIGEEIELPLDEAKEDTRFPARLASQLRANGRMTDMHGYRETTPYRAMEDEEQPMFRYVECWDIREKRLLAWAEGQPFEGFLLDEDYPDGIEDHPYSLLLPVPIIAPEPCPWPKPLVYDWLPIQRDYNTLREQMISAGKRTARKVYYDDNTFPDADEAQKALASSQDMQAVKLNDTGRPPIALPDPPLGVDVARNIPFLLADWQRVTGASGTRLGDPESDTATQAVLVAQHEAVRDSELRGMVLEWLSDGGQKMLQLVKQTLTLDMWVQIKDPNDRDFQEFLRSPGLQAYLALRLGSPEAAQVLLALLPAQPALLEMLRERFGQLKPLQVSRSMLQMEADVSVKPSTMRPVYRAQLLQLAGVLGPAALLSPTFLEELLLSFELPQGERIAEELLTHLQQQGGLAALQGRQAAVPGTPTANGAASPLGTQNPLGAVAAGGGGV